MISEFGKTLLFIIIGFVFVMTALGVSALIRPRKPNAAKNSSYECGEEAVGNVWGNFNSKFYLIALLFLLFEVEIVFLFPWAVVFGKKNYQEATQGSWGIFAVCEAFVFVFVLGLGLAYFWKKGYLEWQKTTPPPLDFQSNIPKSVYDKINEKYK